MRILIEGQNEQNYLAKCHEAFRTGLRGMFDARCFGKGYPRYSRFIKTFQQIQSRIFPDIAPDIVLINTWNPQFLERGCGYLHPEKLTAPKAVFLCDYWSEAGKQLEEYIDFITTNDINFILSFFPQPLSLWRDTPLGERLIYMPPTFDPAIFNDWNVPNKYDVGFLAAGTAEKSDFYPERHIIHKAILRRADLRYLWAPHPGWKEHKQAHPYVGKHFSEAISSCKIFITSGGIYRNAQPKIFEALASKVLLMSDEPVGAELIGLQAGVHYVKISKDDVLENIDYYLAHPSESTAIADAGYRWAMRRHSCYSRALDFYESVTSRLKSHSARGIHSLN